VKLRVLDTWWKLVLVVDEELNAPSTLALQVRNGRTSQQNAIDGYSNGIAYVASNAETSDGRLSGYLGLLLLGFNVIQSEVYVFFFSLILLIITDAFFITLWR
jgi:hypothetical protein